MFAIFSASLPSFDCTLLHIWARYRRRQLLSPHRVYNLFSVDNENSHHLLSLEKSLDMTDPLN